MASIPIWNFSVAAGATFTINQAGTQFLLRIASGSVAVRHRNAKFAAPFDVLTAGYGAKNLNFDAVDVQNLESFPVAVSIFVGDADAIMNEVILQSSQNPIIRYPTYPIALAANEIDFVNLSGQAFTDVNGGKWIALRRQATEIFNLDSGSNFLCYKFGSSGVGVPAIAVVGQAPSGGSLPIQLVGADDFTIKSGTPLNMIASELYEAIPATV